MSPAWFSIATLIPASTMRDRMLFSILTIESMCGSMPPFRSAAAPSTARTIGERTIRRLRASVRAAPPQCLRPCRTSPTSGRSSASRFRDPSASSSALARTFFQFSGSRLPRKRISLKCTTFTLPLPRNRAAGTASSSPSPEPRFFRFPLAAFALRHPRRRRTQRKHRTLARVHPPGAGGCSCSNGSGFRSITAASRRNAWPVPRRTNPGAVAVVVCPSERGESRMRMKGLFVAIALVAAPTLASAQHQHPPSNAAVDFGVLPDDGADWSPPDWSPPMSSGGCDRRPGRSLLLQAARAHA